jgi:NitT/TauT family transport system substrate-binding protein
MIITRRAFAAGSAAALAAGTVRAQSTETIRIGYFPDIWSGAIVQIADRQRLFQERRLDPDFQRFTAGPPAIAALSSGNLDLAYVGLGPMPTIMKGVANVVGLDNLTFLDQLLVQPEAGVNDVAGLRGKTVMVPRGSGAQILLYLALARAGLKPSDINEVAGNPATIVSAMVAKQAPAAAIWAPFNVEIAQRAGTRVLASGRDFYPEYVWPGFWIAHPGLVQNRPDTLRRALGAIQRATTWRAENRQEAARLAGAAYNLSDTSIEVALANTQWMSAADVAKAFEDGTMERWLGGVNGQLTAIGAIEQPTPPSAFFRPQLYLEAHRSGLGR